MAVKVSHIYTSAFNHVSSHPQGNMIEIAWVNKVHFLHCQDPDIRIETRRFEHLRTKLTRKNILWSIRKPIWIMTCCQNTQQYIYIYIYIYICVCVWVWLCWTVYVFRSRYSSDGTTQFKGLMLFRDHDDIMKSRTSHFTSRFHNLAVIDEFNFSNLPQMDFIH